MVSDQEKSQNVTLQSPSCPILKNVTQIGTSRSPKPSLKGNEVLGVQRLGEGHSSSLSLVKEGKQGAQRAQSHLFRSPQVALTIAP